jgi:hypothetical protein
MVACQPAWIDQWLHSFVQIVNQVSQTPVDSTLQVSFIATYFTGNSHLHDMDKSLDNLAKLSFLAVRKNSLKQSPPTS